MMGAVLLAIMIPCDKELEVKSSELGFHGFDSILLMNRLNHFDRVP